jgi:dolichyl-phosphate beta-glucosyltransferase
MTTPRLSIVIPAFNEEKRIVASLQKVGEFLTQLPYPTEVIVSDDGSREFGLRAAEEGLNGLPDGIERRLLRADVNRGKGAAVRAGCLAARGDFVAFLDADLATPPEELPKIVAALEAGADLAVGIRRQPDGSDMRNQRSLPRRLAGSVFTFAMQTLLLPGVSDSQCPLKGFTRESAHRLFQLQRIDTWSFDAEVLFLANRLNLKMAEIAVRWEDVPGSRFQINLRNLRELWNLLKIRFEHRKVNAATLAAPMAVGTHTSL